MLKGALAGRALITLDFDLLVFNSTAHGAFLFKRFSDRFQFCGWDGKAVDNRHRFPAASFGLARDPYNAISNMAGTVATAYAASGSPVTLRAKSALIRAVNRVGFNFFFHDLFGMFFYFPSKFSSWYGVRC